VAEEMDGQMDGYGLLHFKHAISSYVMPEMSLVWRRFSCGTENSPFNHITICITWLDQPMAAKSTVLDCKYLQLSEILSVCLYNHLKSVPHGMNALGTGQMPQSGSNITGLW